MRIRALANGNVIEAHEDAAKELIEAGIYEKADDVPTSPASNNSTQPPAEPKPAAKRRPKAR